MPILLSAGARRSASLLEDKSPGLQHSTGRRPGVVTARRPRRGQIISWALQPGNASAVGQSRSRWLESRRSAHCRRHAITTLPHNGASPTSPLPVRRRSATRHRTTRRVHFHSLSRAPGPAAAPRFRGDRHGAAPADGSACQGSHRGETSIRVQGLPYAMHHSRASGHSWINHGVIANFVCS